MVQYGMLASNPTRATAEQQALEAKLLERVTAIKGTTRQLCYLAVYFKYFKKIRNLYNCFRFSGDVGLINMGMTEEDHAYLSTEIDFIIHAAAYVNLIYPYQVANYE